MVDYIAVKRFMFFDVVISSIQLGVLTHFCPLGYFMGLGYQHIICTKFLRLYVLNIKIICTKFFEDVLYIFKKWQNVPVL